MKPFYPARIPRTISAVAGALLLPVWLTAQVFTIDADPATHAYIGANPDDIGYAPDGFAGPPGFPGNREPGQSTLFYEVDAFSARHATDDFQTSPIFGRYIASIEFSVDRNAVGLQQTDVYREGALSLNPPEAAGDVFVSTTFSPFGSDPDGTNLLMYNYDDTPPAGLTPLNGPLDLAHSEFTPEGVSVNVDGWENSQPKKEDDVFFSYGHPDPSIPGMGIPAGFSLADVLIGKAGPHYDDPANVLVFASAVDLGLDSQWDNIDALTVFDSGQLGVFDAGDQILFSLAPGSPFLAAHSFSAADVLDYSFNLQGVGVFATARSLGLDEGDNLDALDLRIVPEPRSVGWLGVLGLLCYGWGRKRLR